MIERKILIGMITDTELLKQVASVYRPECFKSGMASRLSSWCIEYYDKYNKAPNKDIEGIYFTKLKGPPPLPQDIAEEIEQDILPGLSDEYEREGNDQFLLDQTIRYFQERVAYELNKGQRNALERGDIDEFYKLQSTFKPIVLNGQKEQLNTWDMYNMEIKPVDWIIENLLPKGLTIFGGKSKTGKSYLIMNIIMNLAQGRWMFADNSATGYHGKRGRILYLALEDPMARVIQRMRDIDPNPSETALKRNLDIKLSWQKLHMGGLAAIENWIKKEKRKPKLVVIDTMARVWSKSTKTGGGNLYAEEYSIYGPLADLAHKYDMGIIVITHTLKNPQRDVFDEILGGSGTYGPADNLMVLSRMNEKRRLSIRGKDMDELHLMFSVTELGAMWECEGEVSEVLKTAERQSLYDWLEIKGSSTFSEIEQAAKDELIDVSPRSVKTILRKMIKEGKLEQNKKYGKYYVAGDNDNLVRFGKKKEGLS